MQRSRETGNRTYDPIPTHLASLISGYPGSPPGGLEQEFQRCKAMFGEAHIVHTPGLIALTEIPQLCAPKFLTCEVGST